MDGDEVFDRASLGSTSSVNKIIHPYVQIGPGTVRAPARIMLSLLLERLNIPDAIYRRRPYSHDTVSVTVLFYTSPPINGVSPPQMTITGVRSANQEVAEDSAAVAAIRYMENATNTIVIDLNYAGFKRMQQDNGYLRLRLNDAFEAIDKLSKGCLIVVRYMCAFSDQLHNVIAHAFPPARAVDKTTNETLMNIEVVANNLKDRSHHLEKKLYKVKRRAQAREHEIFAPVIRRR
ncbi:hypothetical protein VPH35_105621 [Triticum aestivum]